MTETKDPKQEAQFLKATYLKGYREGFQASQKMCAAMILGNAEDIQDEEVKHLLRRLSDMLIA
jgi:uncharacterized protein YnzC (UPF0291/DUF896 family)